MSANLLPQLPTVSFRPMQGAADAEAVCHVIHASREHDGIDPYSTLEGLPTVKNMASVLANLPPSHGLIAEVDGQVVGYNRLLWWVEDGQAIYLQLGRVLPAYRRRGIGTALLHWGEARSRALAHERPTAHAMYSTQASNTEQSARALFSKHDYQAVYRLAELDFTRFNRLYLEPPPPWLAIRPARPEDAELMWLTHYAANEDIALSEAPLPTDEDIAELADIIAETGTLWQVAWVGDVVVGQAWCSTYRYDGQEIGIIDEVHTLPIFRRQGVGKTLVRLALFQFQQMGINRVRLHTDDTNPHHAKTFYEYLGFTPTKVFYRYRKPMHP